MFKKRRLYDPLLCTLICYNSMMFPFDSIHSAHLLSGTWNCLEASVETESDEIYSIYIYEKRGVVSIQLISDVSAIFNLDRLCVSQSITATSASSASFDAIGLAFFHCFILFNLFNSHCTLVNRLK